MTKEYSEEDRAAAMDKLMKDRLVIPLEGLKRIAEHKYVAGVYTPMDNWMNAHVWTPLIDFMPKSVAPNTVTVTGLCFEILGFACVASYCPDFKAAAPKWAYAIATFTIFAYQTLDALDGKQARRTGSSSPLGQLFDHGCDSVVTVFLGMLTAMCLHLGFSVRCVTFMFCMLVPFWMTQWSEYHAHVLPTNIGGLIGVTEAQLVAMGICAVNMFSTDFWTMKLVGSMPPWWCGEDQCPIALHDVMAIFQGLVAVTGVCTCFQAVFIHAKHKWSAVWQTVPVWAVAVMGYAWCNLLPQAHPRLVLFSMGVAFSYMTCKMIVAAMSQTDYATFQSPVIALAIIFFVAYFRLLPRHDDVLLGVYCALTIASMARWVHNAIKEITHYIGIHTFRLGKREGSKQS